MEEFAASRTALITSLMRAAHTRLSPDPLITDPWGDRLVSQEDRDLLQRLILDNLDRGTRQELLATVAPAAMLDTALMRRSTYPSVIIRSRYAEDVLRSVVALGARQYLILGAGFDSFALRQPVFARALEIFEVDHPATQQLKQRRLRDCGLSLPMNVHLVSADLANEQLGDCLNRSAFRSDRLAFISWLGVTAYLSHPANLATLRAIASSVASGSELVFTYIDQRELDADRRFESFGHVQTSIAALGEPWISGFEPSQLAGTLREAGLTLLEDLNGEAMRVRYCHGRKDNLHPSEAYHIARARVS
jgi:methyltransferase (TIGR00027 family)